MCDEISAESEIAELKNLCHKIFDSYWYAQWVAQFEKNKNKNINKFRRNAYHKLAQEMRVDAFKCHFRSMNDIDTLLLAYQIISKWE